MQVQSLGWEDPLEEGTTTYSSILAWRMPRTEEPGELWSIGWQRVGHNWSDLACMQARTGSQALWSNMESGWTWREEYWAWTLKPLKWKWALCSVTQRRYIVWHYMLETVSIAKKWGKWGLQIQTSEIWPYTKLRSFILIPKAMDSSGVILTTGGVVWSPSGFRIVNC